MSKRGTLYLFVVTTLAVGAAYGQSVMYSSSVHSAPMIIPQGGSIFLVNDNTVADPAFKVCLLPANLEESCTTRESDAVIHTEECEYVTEDCWCMNWILGNVSVFPRRSSVRRLTSKCAWIALPERQDGDHFPYYRTFNGVIYEQVDVSLRWQWSPTGIIPSLSAMKRAVAQETTNITLASACQSDTRKKLDQEACGIDFEMQIFLLET